MSLSDETSLVLPFTAKLNFTTPLLPKTFVTYLMGVTLDLMAYAKWH